MNKPLDAVFCNQCGHRNPPSSNFCSSCGSPLDVPGEERTIVFHPVDPLQDSESSDDDVRVNLADLPLDLGVLLVRSGPQAGLRVRLQATITQLGRRPESDVYLDDITVSRNHAEVTHREREFFVEDVGSLNGTYVNQERIEESTQIRHGDELQIDKFKLVFLSSAQ
jgi:pSer/pThr/pTyr-binding forkhead associated (FHA) protein